MRLSATVLSQAIFVCIFLKFGEIIHVQEETSNSAGGDDRKARRQSRFFNRECEMRSEVRNRHGAKSDINDDMGVPDAFVKPTSVPQCMQKGSTDQASVVSIRPFL